MYRCTHVMWGWKLKPSHKMSTWRGTFNVCWVLFSKVSHVQRSKANHRNKPNWLSSEHEHVMACAGPWILPSEPNLSRCAIKVPPTSHIRSGRIGLNTAWAHHESSFNVISWSVHVEIVLLYISNLKHVLLLTLWHKNSKRRNKTRNYRVTIKVQGTLVLLQCDSCLGPFWAKSLAPPEIDGLGSKITWGLHSIAPTSLPSKSPRW